MPHKKQHKVVHLRPGTRETISGIKAGAERSGQRVVFVSGNFNIVHPGHLRLLRFAAECGDILVVGVLADAAAAAILPEDLRLEAVRAVTYVHHAFLLHDSVEDLISVLQPAVVVKGKEHEGRKNPEAEAVGAYGGRLIFSSGDISFSSIDLLREDAQLNASTIRLPPDYLRRHDIDRADLEETVRKFAGLRVLVFGDTIVDEYITCDPLGMSQEDPTIVVTPILSNRFIGGAAIVAAHAAGLGGHVRCFSIVGEDATANFVRSELDRLAIDHELMVDENRPTTLKQRYRSRGQTLLRVSHLRQQAMDETRHERVIAAAKELLDSLDLVIFSDFNYGFLPQPLVVRLVDMFSAAGIMMVADSQSSSQVGDVSRFLGMTLLTPTEREARLAVNDFTSGLVVLAESLRQKARAANVVITLGEEGLLIHAPKSGDWLTDRLPAFNTAPRDVAGAGDSFLTCASMACAAGANIWHSSYLGSIAAACQVGRVGNIPLSQKDLLDEI